MFFFVVILGQQQHVSKQSLGYNCRFRVFLSIEITSIIQTNNLGNVITRCQTSLKVAGETVTKAD